MKKILAIIAAMSLVFSMAACGKKKDDSGITGAGKDVDMSKVEGEALKVDEDAENAPKGNIGNYYVSIDDAKIVEVEGSKRLVVSFTFTNNSKQADAFSNLFDVEITQNGTSLAGAPIAGVEGINALAAVEPIEPGKTTKVQRMCHIMDEEAPVEVSVCKYGEPEKGMAKKTLKLK